MTADGVVIGAGAAGLAAVAHAPAMGPEVVVLGKALPFGGTSALWGAAIRVPRRDDADAALHPSALVGQRAFFLIRAGVPVRLGAQVKRLRVEGERVTGVGCADGPTSARSVILAGGGQPTRHPFSLASPTLAARGIALALSVGGCEAPAGLFRTHVPIHQRNGRAQSLIAHLGLGRATPGAIAADTAGRRFTNKAGRDRRFGAAISPCPAPLTQGPFTALRGHPAIPGTAQLRLKAGQVSVRRDRAPNPGLHAIGNVRPSITGSTSPRPEITRGPALVFAWMTATPIAQGDAS
jgi:hypothetical protein